MAEFNTFDLGRVFQTAEAIKGLRRQGTIDKLQEQYLGQRIQAGQQEMDIQKRTQEIVLGKEKAQQVATKTAQILQASNPKNYVEQFEPDLVKALTAQGVDWATADDNTVKQMVTAMQNKANQELGQAPLTTQQVGGFNTLQQGGKVIASAAPKQATPDALTERWRLEVQNGYEGSLLDYQKELKAAGRKPTAPAKPPSGYRWSADGNLEPIPGGPATKETKTGNVTEGERKAAALGTRLDAALTELTQLDAVDSSASKPGLMEKIAGVAGETAANLARSDTRQQADAAQLDALDAALTLATGAAYTKEQLQNLRKSYFPQLGDTEATVAAKKNRFETVVKTARIAAGRAEPSIDKANEAPGSIPVGQSVKVGNFTLRRIN